MWTIAYTFAQPSKIQLYLQMNSGDHEEVCVECISLYEEQI